MLSQTAFKALSFSKNKVIQFSFLPISTYSTPNYGWDNPHKNPGRNEEKPIRKLQEWRESFEGKQPVIPLDADITFFKIFRTKVEMTPWGIQKSWKKRLRNLKRESQQYIPQRQKVLGPDLALAHFLTYIGGKVRFKGKDEWVILDTKTKEANMPSVFDPNYVITEIDASDILLYYEGLENFKDCPRVKWASFARNKEMDDWCVDRIASYFPFIEYLDLSDCPKVSERALEALYKCGMLKTLIVTNNYKSAAFELTCMMLEDVVPGLQVDIREPKEEVKPEINEP